jgi:transglutaminase-like putative cysteine protease
LCSQGHRPLKAMRVLWEPLSQGDAGITKTLATMRALKDAATRDPYIVQTARNLVARAASRDPADQAQAIYTWLKDHQRFVQDPVGYELVVAPRRLLDDIRRQGYFQEDCDGSSTLMAALAESVGIRSRFHVFGRRPPRAGDSGFSHVLTELSIAGQWVPYDLTVESAEPGWRPPSRGPEAVY